MHTTTLNVEGFSDVVLIHNGDFSGDSYIRWLPKDHPVDKYREIILPDGFLRALILSVLTSVIPGKLETFLNRRAGQEFLLDILFR
jgi:hypothetical protein